LIDVYVGNGEKLDFAARARIALAVARGVAFIHRGGPISSHGDIKSSNVVVTATRDAAYVTDYEAGRGVPRAGGGRRAARVAERRRVQLRRAAARAAQRPAAARRDAGRRRRRRPAAVDAVGGAGGVDVGGVRPLARVPGLAAEGVHGVLLGDLQVQRLAIELPRGGSVVIEGLRSQGLQLALAEGGRPRLQIERLAAERVSVTPGAPADPPSPPPTSLALPLELEVQTVAVATLTVAPLGVTPLQQLQAHVHLGADGGRQHRIAELSLAYGKLRAQANATLGTVDPLPLQATLALTQDGALANARWSARATLAGALAQPQLQATLRADPAEAREALRRIADGDLLAPAASRGGSDSLMGELERTRLRLQALVAQVRASSDGIHTASNEIAVGNADLSSRTEQAARGAAAGVAAHDADGVALAELQVGVLGVGDVAGLDQRDRHLLVADRQGPAGELVLEAELEGGAIEPVGHRRDGPRAPEQAPEDVGREAGQARGEDRREGRAPQRWASQHEAEHEHACARGGPSRCGSRSGGTRIWMTLRR